MNDRSIFKASTWNRGVLPVAAALAVLLAIFALVAGPAWFAREKTGFEAPNYLATAAVEAIPTRSKLSSTAASRACFDAWVRATVPASTSSARAFSASPRRRKSSEGSSTAGTGTWTPSFPTFERRGDITSTNRRPALIP
ncbi:MAG: hypothetical protein ACHQCH_04155 [Solirubrobacterales bacterium]